MKELTKREILRKTQRNAKIGHLILSEDLRKYLRTSETKRTNKLCKCSSSGVCGIRKEPCMRIINHHTVFIKH